jgi:hypothetical protein
MADVFAELMSALGYQRFGAQGADWEGRSRRAWASRIRSHYARMNEVGRSRAEGRSSSLAEKSYTDIRRWSAMKKGGHFAALEEPEALASEIEAFFTALVG